MVQSFLSNVQVEKREVYNNMERKENWIDIVPNNYYLVCVHQIQQYILKNFDVLLW
jgi:hypothetical protein